MKRCLAYGMFPGFFSAQRLAGPLFHAAGTVQSRSAAVQAVRPLCKRVAEAGWEPITLAHTDNDHVYVERFGNRSAPFSTTAVIGSQPASATCLHKGI